MIAKRQKVGIAVLVSPLVGVFAVGLFTEARVILLAVLVPLATVALAATGCSLIFTDKERVPEVRVKSRVN